MNNNILIVNGERYRLVPMKAEWGIRLINRTGGGLCPTGHNGCKLPEGHEILAVTLGDESFMPGDRLVEGVIERFVYEYGYVQAKIEGSETYVDIDNFKKADIKHEDGKKETLEKVLGTDFTKLTPFSLTKSKLFMLDDREFDTLFQHVYGNSISKRRCEEEGWDTILIGRMIFKRFEEKNNG